MKFAIKAPRVLVLLTLAGVLVSCGGGKERRAEARGGASPVSKAADDIPASNDPSVHMERFRFGDKTDADGIVVRERSALPPDSMVAMSFYVRNVPSGTQVRIVWSDTATDTAKGEETGPVGDKGFVTFKHAKPFPVGKYRVTMYYKQPEGKSWAMLGTHDFKVGGPS
jgi:hypothetical protein